MESITTVAAERPTHSQIIPSVGPEYDFRSQPWLRQQLDKAKKTGPFTECVTITPFLAKEMLAKNEGNRNVRANKVAMIANDIRDDRYILNGETIILDEDGMLNDGQHRLLAVIQAKKTIKTMVVFGVSRESRLTVDGGAARTVADYLNMDGRTNASVVAAAARLHWGYMHGIYGLNARTDASKQAYREEFYKYEKEFVHAVERTEGEAFKNMHRTAMIVGYMLISRIDPHGCDLFFMKLATGENLPAGSPALKCRDHLMNVADKRLRSWEKLELLLRYWNAFALGQSRKLRMSIQNEYPLIEGPMF